MKNKKTGLGRVIAAFGYSLCGFRSAFKTEAAFRQEILLTVILLPVIFFLDIGGIERVLLIFTLFFILFAELINTAIEAVVDRVGEEYNILSKKAKDVGSALVLLAFINAVVVWVIILFFS